MAKKERYFLCEYGQYREITMQDIVDHYNSTEPPFEYTEDLVDLDRFKQEMSEIDTLFIVKKEGEPFITLRDGEDAMYQIDLCNPEYPSSDMFDEEHRVSTLNTIYDKIKAIINNLDKLCDYDIEAGKYTKDNVRYVEVDLEWQFDEFFIAPEDEDNIEVIEVVTKEIAESNDKDWLRSYELDEYRVGEVNSNYKKLGDSDYYYRFL